MLTNNWIFSRKPDDYAKPKDEVIHLNACGDVHISNNDLKCYTGVRGISINGSNNITITGNTIQMVKNAAGQNIYVDANSYYNIIKDNVLRGDASLYPVIIVYGNKNIVKDNINAHIHNYGTNNLVNEIVW